MTSAVPYVVSVDLAAQAVFQSYGAKWVEYTNQGTPTQWTAGINQAIAQHANAIILGQGMAIQLVVPALKKAAAAHIPVIVTHDFQNGQMNTAPPTGPGANVLPYITAFVNVPFWQAAQLEADYVIVQTNGNAHDMIIKSSDVPPSNGIADAEVKEFKTYCPACKVTVDDVPLAQWGTKIAPDVQSAIGADPALTWITPLYDSMALFAQQAITAAGKVGKVQDRLVQRHAGRDEADPERRQDHGDGRRREHPVARLRDGRPGQPRRPSARRSSRAATRRRRCGSSPRRTSARQATRPAPTRATATRTSPATTSSGE